MKNSHVETVSALGGALGASLMRMLCETGCSYGLVFWVENIVLFLGISSAIPFVFLKSKNRPAPIWLVAIFFFGVGWAIVLRLVFR